MQLWFSRIFFAQWMLFFSGALGFFLTPRMILAVLTARRFEDLLPPAQATLPQLAVDQIRVIGTFLIPMAWISALSILRTDVGFRRSLARLFAFFTVTWTVVFWFNIATGRYGPLGLVLFGVPGTLSAAAMLYFSFALKPERPVRWDFGSSDGRPPMLWITWVFQALVGFAWGAARAFRPHECLAFMVGDDRLAAMSPEEVLLAVDQVRMVAPYTLFLGAASLVAVVQERLSVWNPFRRAFIMLLVTWIFTLFWNVATGSYLLLNTLVTVVPAALLLAINVTHRPVRDPGVALAFPPGDTDWNTMDLLAGPLMALQAFRQRRRASHLVGVGASGRFTFAPDPSVPRVPFFREPRAVTATARFANLTLLDDAGLDVRGMSLRLTGDDGTTFDLMSNTGATCPAGNLVEFATFVMSKSLPPSVTRAVVLGDARKLEGAVEGLRRAPESFAKLHFYSQRVIFWVDEEGRRFLVRFRVVPSEAGPESGLPDDDDTLAVWKRARLPNESRPSDYLRAELAARVTHSGVRMKLQAQFHRPRAGETLGWFDASLAWPLDAHPWLDLGELHLVHALADEETERLTFDPTALPRGLGVPPSTGPLDPRSLAESEARVVPRLQRLRLEMYASLGYPPFGDLLAREKRS